MRSLILLDVSRGVCVSARERARASVCVCVCDWVVCVCVCDWVVCDTGLGPLTSEEYEDLILLAGYIWTYVALLAGYICRT